MIRQPGLKPARSWKPFDDQQSWTAGETNEERLDGGSCFEMDCSFAEDRLQPPSPLHLHRPGDPGRAEAADPAGDLGRSAALGRSARLGGDRSPNLLFPLYTIGGGHLAPPPLAGRIAGGGRSRRLRRVRRWFRL